MVTYSYLDPSQIAQLRGQSGYAIASLDLVAGEFPSSLPVNADLVDVSVTSNATFLIDPGYDGQHLLIRFCSQAGAYHITVPSNVFGSSILPTPLVLTGGGAYDYLELSYCAPANVWMGLVWTPGFTPPGIEQIVGDFIVPDRAQVIMGQAWTGVVATFRLHNTSLTTSDVTAVVHSNTTVSGTISVDGDGLFSVTATLTLTSSGATFTGVTISIPATGANLTVSGDITTAPLPLQIVINPMSFVAGEAGPTDIGTADWDHDLYPDYVLGQVMMNWGDFSSDNLTKSGTSPVHLSLATGHTYNDPGSHTINVSANDPTNTLQRVFATVTIS